MLELKWVALICLVLQNSGLAIMMRYTLINSNNDGKYMTSTAVYLAELLKFILSSLLCYIYDSKMNNKNFILILKSEFLCYGNGSSSISKGNIIGNGNVNGTNGSNSSGGSSSDWIKLMIPSILYTIQNSLQYYSMSCLSAAVFQVLLSSLLLLMPSSSSSSSISSSTSSSSTTTLGFVSNENYHYCYL